MAMPENEYRAHSARIASHLGALPELRAARVIHSYWPILSKREADIRPLLNELHLSGKQIVLPRVVAYSGRQEGLRRLEHRLFSGETNLRANRWEIGEPVHTVEVPVSNIDVIIAPALAVDLKGYRLGYGMGYYDEFLAEATCPILCPAFECCITNRLPSSSYDIPVDVILSEKGSVRIAKDAT